MKKLLFFLPFIFIFAVSCGDDLTPADTENQENPTDQADSADTTENQEPADAGDTTDPVEPSGDTEPAEPSEIPDKDEPQEPEEPAAEKFCQYRCTTVSDCIQGESNATNDEDNYKCENHKCVYLGCLNDAECEEVYESVTAATGTVYRCNKNGAYGYPECTPACSSAADCNNLCEAGTTQYAYDLDNYKCESGLCVYTGCNSDSECEATMSSSDYKCLTQEYSGKTLNVCNLPCETAADCGNMVYPEEVYLCENRQCKMKSCESDEWCAENINSKFSCL
ncbi:hypothetical protein IKP13_08380 [bacterium]|nr:hypothetical protein [bacterium]